MRLTFLLAAALTFAATASAHHGFTGRYNTAEPIWIEGVVESAHIGPPHIEVRIKVAADQAAPPARTTLAGLEDALRPRAPAPDLAVRPEISSKTVLL